MIDGHPHSDPLKRAARVGLLALLAGMTAGAASAGEMARPPQSPTTPEVRTYCQNIAGAAADARFAWQTQKLESMETRVKAELGILVAKTA